MLFDGYRVSTRDISSYLIPFQQFVHWRRGEVVLSRWEELANRLGPWSLDPTPVSHIGGYPVSGMFPMAHPEARIFLQRRLGCRKEMIHRLLQVEPQTRCRGAPQKRKRSSSATVTPMSKSKKVSPDVIASRKQMLAEVGSLREASVGEGCRRRYAESWKRMELHLGKKFDHSTPASVVDVGLAEMLEFMFGEGEDLSAGQYMMAATLFKLPHLRSTKQSMLPLSRQSMQGWRKMDPPKSRLPLPWEVTCLISMHCLKHQQVQAALMIATCFALYLRPGEVTRLRGMDLVRPVQTNKKEKSHWAVVLHPAEEEISSKTGEFDETVMFDLEEHKFLPAAIYRLRSVGSSNPHSPIFNLTSQQLKKTMEEAGKALNLECLGPIHPYRLRHGGASRDFALKRRRLEEIQRRGRWRSFASVRRYEKGGRLQQLLQLLPQSTLDQAVKATKDVEHAFHSRRWVLVGLWVAWFSLRFSRELEILAAAVAKHTVWPVLVWDICLGAEYDLRSPAKRHLISNWIKSGWIAGLHLGTPCESFSRARDVPPGPPPLRSNERPMGLDCLRPADQIKVTIGNMFMRFSAFLLSLCLRLGVPATMENPQRSRIWLCPPIAAIIRKRQVSWNITHYCAWGKPFKKATVFLAIHVALNRLCNGVCHSSKRGICQHTGGHHIQLCGRNSQGQWNTKVAEPYPPKMCVAIARDFSDFFVARIANNFSKHLVWQMSATPAGTQTWVIVSFATMGHFLQLASKASCWIGSSLLWRSLSHHLDKRERFTWHSCSLNVFAEFSLVQADYS